MAGFVGPVTNVLCMYIVIGKYRCRMTYIYLHIHIHKKICIGGSKARHIAPRGVNSTILFVYRTGYAYGKKPKGFQKVFLGPFSTG